MRTHMTNLIENPPISKVFRHKHPTYVRIFSPIAETKSRAGEGHMEGPHRHHNWYEALPGRDDAAIKLDGQHAQGVGHAPLR